MVSSRVYCITCAAFLYIIPLIHVGNGTEEGFIPDERCFYGSTHEIDNFPGTGLDPTPYIGSKAKQPLHRRIVNRYLHPRQHCNSHVEQSIRQEFRIKWNEIIDEMILFNPQLVIISAGFDAHDDDPLASCDLIEEDYYWATEVVLKACYIIDPELPAKCVSVLEGGYDIRALSASALAHVQALERGYPPTPPPSAAEVEEEGQAAPIKKDVKVRDKGLVHPTPPTPPPPEAAVLVSADDTTTPALAEVTPLEAQQQPEAQAQNGKGEDDLGAALLASVKQRIDDTDLLTAEAMRALKLND